MSDAEKRKSVLDRLKKLGSSISAAMRKKLLISIGLSPESTTGKAIIKRREEEERQGLVSKKRMKVTN